MIIWNVLIKLLVLCIFNFFLILKCRVRKADNEEVMNTFLLTEALYIWYSRWANAVVLATACNGDLILAG